MHTYMFVRTLDAAVCAIARSPALLDVPIGSVALRPVTLSVGG